MSQFVKPKRQANLKILSDLEPLRGSSNNKTVYSTRSCVNWARSCQKKPNLHTNLLNKLLIMAWIILVEVTGGYNVVKRFDFRFLKITGEKFSSAPELVDPFRELFEAKKQQFC
jgi:hypothetical protein